MNWREHIHSDPGILGGKPVIKGSRVSVELVLEVLAEGAPISEIVDAYHVSEESVRAAVAFTHDILVKEAVSAQREAA